MKTTPAATGPSLFCFFFGGGGYQLHLISSDLMRRRAPPDASILFGFWSIAAGRIGERQIKFVHDFILALINWLRGSVTAGLISA